MHTCTRDIAVLRAQNRQSASWALWSTLALPNRPSRTFAYVYEGFGCSESPKCTFGALGLSRAVPVAMRVKSAGGQTDGELGSRDGLPYRQPGSHHSPARCSGPRPKHIPCAGLQAFPPHSNLFNIPHMPFVVSWKSAKTPRIQMDFRIKNPFAFHQTT